MKQSFQSWALLSLTMLSSSWCGTQANAQSAMDGKFRTQITGKDGTPIIIARNPFDPLAWHFIPTSLRVAMKDGIPMIRWVDWVENGTQHSVLQAALTGALTLEEDQQARIAAVKHLEAMRQKDPSIVVPTPAQIKLSSVGQLTNARIQAMLVQNGGVQMVLNGATMSNPESVDKEQAPPITGAASVGASTEISGVTWVQLSVDGVGVQVVREMLKGGGNGGIIFALSALYPAWQVESHIDIKMNVKAVQSFFRDRKEVRSGWSFLCFGSSSHKVTDFIKQHSELNSNIEFVVANGGMNEDELAKIQERLYVWITSQVSNGTKAAPPSENAPGAAPLSFFNAGPTFSQLLGIPIAGLSIGWGSNSAEFHIGVESSENRIAEAHWHGFQLEQSPIMLYGAVGLQNYSQDIVNSIVGKPIEILPILGDTVIMPPVLEGSPVRHAIVTGTRQNSKGHSIQFASATFDSKQNKWVALGGTDGAKNFFGHPVGFSYAVGESYDATGTEFEALYQPQRANHNALPAILVRKKAKPDGKVVFSDSDFPVRKVTFSSTMFDDQLPRFESIRIGFELTFDGKLLGWQHPQKLTVPSLVREQATFQLEAAGTLVDVKPNAQIVYHDVFAGRTNINNNSDDLARLRSHVLETLTTGSEVSIDPAHFGIQVHGISFRLIRNKPGSEVRGTLISDSGEEAFFNLLRNDQGVLEDAATGKPLIDNLIWLPTRKKISKLELEFDDEGVTKKLDTPKGFETWTKTDRGVLIVR